jgi:uracil-DNA glycosylase
MPREILVWDNQRRMLRVSPSRPRDLASCKILMVGEAAGEQEAVTGLPFMGYSGQELTRILSDAGLTRSEVYLTNVVPFWPPNNDFRFFCIPTKAHKALLTEGLYPRDLGSVESGWYLHPRLISELNRLKAEIELVAPNIVVALGAKALWALTGERHITKFRGTVAESRLVLGQKILPTFHPAYVLRNWSVRPIVVADMIKVKREAQFKEIIRPKRILWIEPTISDMYEFAKRYFQPNTLIGFDVETSPKRNMFRCISFSPDPKLGICIPFSDFRKSNYSYWPTLEEEKQAWRFVEGILGSVTWPKIAQNGIYDVLWSHHMGWRVRNWEHDPMLAHHALLPEMRKSLEFMGSAYTDEVAWKQMRRYSEKSYKREE